MSQFSHVEQPNAVVTNVPIKYNADVITAMTISRKYLASRDTSLLTEVHDTLDKTDRSNIRTYLRWLLSRGERSGVVQVCRYLLGLRGFTDVCCPNVTQNDVVCPQGRTQDDELSLEETVVSSARVIRFVKAELELELIVHVAVDLLQELLKSGLEYSQFLHLPSLSTGNHGATCSMSLVKEQGLTSTNRNACLERLWDSLMFRSLLYGKNGPRYIHRPDPSERYAYVIIVAMIEKCQQDSMDAIADMLIKYPIHPMDTYTFGKVFRALIIGGVSPSDSFILEMKGTETTMTSPAPGYYQPYLLWYREFRTQVPTLRHSARTTIRRSARVNLELLVSTTRLPRDVGDFILMKDRASQAIINLDDVD